MTITQPQRHYFFAGFLFGVPKPFSVGFIFGVPINKYHTAHITNRSNKCHSNKTN